MWLSPPLLDVICVLKTIFPHPNILFAGKGSGWNPAIPAESISFIDKPCYPDDAAG